MIPKRVNQDLKLAFTEQTLKKLILENYRWPAETASFFRHVLGIFPQTLFKLFPLGI